MEEKHICETCKWYKPTLSHIEKEECHGCCSWNDKWEKKEVEPGVQEK